MTAEIAADSPHPAMHHPAMTAGSLAALREGPRHGAAMLRRPRGGRPMMNEHTPPLRPRFTDWALI